MKKMWPVIVLILLGIFYLWKRKEPSSFQAAAPSNPQQTSGGEAAKATLVEQPRPQPQAVIEQHNKMIAMGIKPFAQSGKELKGRFALRWQWCQVGDLEYLKAMSKSHQNKDWRLSIHEAGNNKELSRIQLSLEDILESRAWQFKVKLDPALYALYLCQADGPVCPKQKVLDPTQGLRPRGEAAMMNVQALLKTAQGFRILPLQSWDKKTLQKTEQLLRNEAKVDGAGLASIYEYVQTIKPLTASTDDKGLVIPLTGNNPKCLAMVR